MPHTARTLVDFDTGSSSQTLNYELGTLDLSNADWLLVTAKLTKALTDAIDTCDIYLQSRGGDGVWHDRAHLSQFLGNMTVSATAPEVRYAQVQQAGVLSATETAGEPSGSAGASRLAVASVRNGTFPGRYYTGGLAAASWRVQIVVVDADSNADFEGVVSVEWAEGV